MLPTKSLFLRPLMAMAVAVAGLMSATAVHATSPPIATVQATTQAAAPDTTVKAEAAADADVGHTGTWIAGIVTALVVAFVVIRSRDSGSSGGGSSGGGGSGGGTRPPRPGEDY